jgi:hypothetical protein
VLNDVIGKDLQRTMDTAVSAAATSLQTVRGKPNQTLGGREPRRTRLSEQQQVNSYLNLSHEQRLALIRRHGRAGWEQYRMRMQELIDRGY